MKYSLYFTKRWAAAQGYCKLSSVTQALSTDHLSSFVVFIPKTNPPERGLSRSFIFSVSFPAPVWGNIFHQSTCHNQLTKTLHWKTAPSTVSMKIELVMIIWIGCHYRYTYIHFSVFLSVHTTHTYTYLYKFTVPGMCGKLSNTQYQTIKVK